MFYFPTIRKSLPIPNTTDCKAITEELSRQIDNLHISHTDKHAASCVVNNDSFLFNNSFLPVIEMSIDTSNQLQVYFHLRFSVQIILFVYLFIGLLIQSAILIMLR